MVRKLNCLALITVLLILLNNCSTDKIEYSSENRNIQENKIVQTESVNWIGHWFGEDKREQLVREIATEFEFRNQDIKVNLKFPHEIMGKRSLEEEANFIVKLINSPKPDFDIVWLESGIYNMVSQQLNDPEWGKKYLVDFSQDQKFTDSQKDFIINDSKYRNATGGILIGPYIEGFYFALWYNSEVAKLLGISIKDFGMTSDDFKSYLKAVSEFNNKSTNKIAAIYEASDWVLSEYLFQNLFDSALKDSLPTEQSTKYALDKTLREFEEFGKYKPLISSHKTNIWFDTRDLVLDNKALFYVGGTYMYSHWSGIDKEKMKKMIPVELPSFNKHKKYLGTYTPTFGILKNAPNVENAKKLLVFICKPDNAEKWVRYTKSPTGLKGNLTSSDIGSDIFENFQKTITDKYGGAVENNGEKNFIVNRNPNDYLKLLDQILLDLLDAKISAEQAIQQINNF